MALRIGVIGTADIARRRMIPAIMQCEEFEYKGVAIASSSEWDESHLEEEYVPLLENKKMKAKSFFDEFGGKTYVGYENLIKDDEIDAVYIPLPPSLHYKWGKLALENGKHVLMEKPFCTSYEQTKRLLEIAKKNNLAVIENYGFIYHNQFTKLKDIFESGEIGELREIKASFGFPHRNMTDFRYSKKYGGGALLDCGGYTIKAACEFMEEPEVVYSSLITPVNYEVDLYSSVALRDKKSKITAFLAFGMDNAYKCDFELWGSLGSVVSNRAYTAPEDFDSSITINTKNGSKNIFCGKTNQFMEILKKFYDIIFQIENRKNEEKLLLKQAKLISSVMENNIC